jgi:hypothetical protein
MLTDFEPEEIPDLVRIRKVVVGKSFLVCYTDSLYRALDDAGNSYFTKVPLFVDPSYTSVGLSDLDLANLKDVSRLVGVARGYDASTSTCRDEEAGDQR